MKMTVGQIPSFSVLNSWHTQAESHLNERSKLTLTAEKIVIFEINGSISDF